MYSGLPPIEMTDNLIHKSSAKRLRILVCHFSPILFSLGIVATQGHPVFDLAMVAWSLNWGSIEVCIANNSCTFAVWAPKPAKASDAIEICFNNFLASTIHLPQHRFTWVFPEMQAAISRPLGTSDTSFVQACRIVSKTVDICSELHSFFCLVWQTFQMNVCSVRWMSSTRKGRHSVAIN